jgi:hypothetical protein
MLGFVGFCTVALGSAFGACGGLAASDRNDAPGGPSPVQGSLDTQVGQVAFEECRCHHGFAPGIDGTAQIHVVNSSATSVTLAPGAFILRNRATGVQYVNYEFDSPGRTSSPSPSSYYTLENVPGTQQTPPSFEPVVAPGGSTDISVSFYIDGLMTWPVTPTPYVLEVDLGGSTPATSKTFALTEILDSGIH